ncbi:MAG: PH domain-containing protein [Verrucomicrobiota bacterium]
MQRSKRIPGIKEALMFKAETCETDDSKNVSRYQPKVDWWLTLCFVSLTASGSIASILQFSQGQQAIGLAILASVLIIGGLLALLGYPTTYAITEQHLEVRAGLFLKWNISLGTLREVFPILNIESAPAWSIKRLRINYTVYTNQAYILIAPEDSAGFLQEIVNRCPQLTQVDDRAVYRASLY